MNRDNPYPLPSPVDVATMLMQSAWSDDLSDEDRLRCEYGSETICVLLDRCVKLAKRLELAEARLCEQRK